MGQQQMDRYHQVLAQIEGAHRFGKQPGVEVTAHMLELFGHPEFGMPYIHIAGTNGKGSTCAFINRILQEAGLKVGCFTSPHLIDFCERITVNDVQIGKEVVVRLGQQLLNRQYVMSPTMFDYCLLMALLYFKEQRCDILIIETGLGGRLDSTNALGQPEVSVITRIGYDHMAILGDTLAKIAAEKAGIIKEKVPVVSAMQEKEALLVLEASARDTEFRVISEQDIQRVEGYQPKMNAEYQRENAAVAEAAVRMLLKYHPSLLPLEKGELQACIAKGIHEAFWPGRMQILSRNPFLMADGAHNSNGVNALKRSLQELYPGEKFRFIMGVMADKDYEEMVRLLLPMAESFVTVTPDSERALAAGALAEYIKSRGVSARTLHQMEDIPSVMSREYKNIAMGSLYFIGDVIKLWKSFQR